MPHMTTHLHRNLHMMVPGPDPEMGGAESDPDQLLLECEEEEGTELWFQGSDEDDEGKGGDPLPPSLPLSPPIRNKPQHLHGYDASLGIKLNGLPIAAASQAGGGADLMLVSQHRGGASGFTSLLVLPPPSSTPLPPPPPSPSPSSSGLLQPEPTPIITDVVYGEAAERVLSDCRIPESGPQEWVGVQESPQSLEARCRPSEKTLCLSGRRQLCRPRSCSHCGCKFVLIRKLRGFMCECSTEVSNSLRFHKIFFKHRSNTKTTTSKMHLDPPQTLPLTSARPQSPLSQADPTLRPPPQADSPPRPLPKGGPTLMPPTQADPTLRPPPQADSPPRPLPKGAPTLMPPPQADPILCPPPKGNLVIPLEEFYYGTDDTPTPPSLVKCTTPFQCISCKRAVGNNIQLMQHIERHAAATRGSPANDITSCAFCYRRFSSPFTLQCHLEAVHTKYQSTAVCKICELSFVDEQGLLQHMKMIHKPGEMPYVCQVCGFRSSFYSVLRGHFETVHADTYSMLCLYCLRVHRYYVPYQNHHSKHQRRNVFPCGSCRLYFLSSKERADHKVLHHGTHRRPPQVHNLPPGTTVTIRAYTVVRGRDEPKNRPVPSKVIDMAPRPPPQESPRAKPPETSSLLSLQLKTRSSEVKCVECSFDLPDMSHFVSLLHCSHCKYLTHCSRAYANHMISDHATQRTKTNYTSMFQLHRRCGWRLRCVSCSFSTRTGDIMANHMTDNAHHTCSIALVEHSGTQNRSRPRHHPTKRLDANASTTLAHKTSILKQLNHCSEEKQGQLLSGGGAFIPIHLLTSGTASTQLSVKLLSSPPPPCSSPAMTIRVLGPQLHTAQSGAEPVTRTTASTVKASLGSTVGSSAPGGGVGAVLGPDKLQVVLFALCSGLPQASQRYQMDPAVIQSWILQREQDLEHRTWSWDTEPVAEWVLIQREQQFAVQESSLLQAGVGVLGGVQYGWGGLHGWVVDLMLHHHLSLQCTVQSHDSPLPRTFAHKTLRFLRQLHTQMRTCQPGSLGCMDELSVFSDPAGLKGRPVLQLYGRSESRWCDVVLSGLADGTFLKPVLFFRGPQLCLPHGFPDNVLLEARPEGFTDQQRLQLWFNKVWRPHVERGRGLSLLLTDKHRGHEGAEFHAALQGYSTHSAIIPIGCSTRLQPLDICIAPVVREFLQARWRQLVEAAAGGGLEEELGLEKLALTLACWLSEVASTLDQMPNVLTSSSQKREGQVQMIAALAESLIGQQREPTGDEGDVKV